MKHYDIPFTRKLSSSFQPFSTSPVPTVSLTICVWCDHLLVGHHSRCGIVNLKARKGKGRRGKEAKDIRENDGKLSAISHTHTHTLYFSEQKKLNN